jgi:hypothetical protein
MDKTGGAPFGPIANWLSDFGLCEYGKACSAAGQRLWSSSLLQAA